MWPKLEAENRRPRGEAQHIKWSELAPMPKQASTRRAGEHLARRNFDLIRPAEPDGQAFFGV
jgi:hypothetical protein